MGQDIKGDRKVMKQVEYFEIQDRKILFVKYNDGNFVYIDLCALFGLEMVKEEKENKQ